MERKSSPILAAMTTCLVIAGLYVGTYLANVKTRTLASSGIPPWAKVPEYRVGGNLAELVFQPLHRCDRQIRKDYWHYYGVADEFVPAFKLLMKSWCYDYDDPAVAELTVKLRDLIHSISSRDHPTRELQLDVRQAQFELQRTMDNSTKRPGPLYDWFKSEL